MKKVKSKMYPNLQKPKNKKLILQKIITLTLFSLTFSIITEDIHLKEKPKFFYLLQKGVTSKKFLFKIDEPQIFTLSVQFDNFEINKKVISLPELAVFAKFKNKTELVPYFNSSTTPWTNDEPGYVIPLSPKPAEYIITLTTNKNSFLEKVGTSVSIGEESKQTSRFNHPVPLRLGNNVLVGAVYYDIDYDFELKPDYKYIAEFKQCKGKARGIQIISYSRDDGKEDILVDESLDTDEDEEEDPIKREIEIKPGTKRIKVDIARKNISGEGFFRVNLRQIPQIIKDDILDFESNIGESMFNADQRILNYEISENTAKTNKIFSLINFQKDFYSSIFQAKCGFSYELYLYILKYFGDNDDEKGIEYINENGVVLGERNSGLHRVEVDEERKFAYGNPEGQLYAYVKIIKVIDWLEAGESPVVLAKRSNSVYLRPNQLNFMGIKIDRSYLLFGGGVITLYILYYIFCRRSSSKKEENVEQGWSTTKISGL